MASNGKLKKQFLKAFYKNDIKTMDRLKKKSVWLVWHTLRPLKRVKYNTVGFKKQYLGNFEYKVKRMSIPIFKMPKIIHSSVKARKEFIIDLICISFGETTLRLSIKDEYNVSDGVNALHPNKDRKQLKKINEAYEYLYSKKIDILHRLSIEDAKTVEHKVKQLSKLFVSEIGSTSHVVNLELMAICFLDYGLTGRKRKAKRNTVLDSFCKMDILYKQIGANVEKAGYTIAKEWDLVKSFIDKVRY
jgi:hypothetical protein